MVVVWGRRGVDDAKRVLKMGGCRSVLARIHEVPSALAGPDTSHKLAGKGHSSSNKCAQRARVLLESSTFNTSHDGVVSARRVDQLPAQNDMPNPDPHT